MKIEVVLVLLEGGNYERVEGYINSRSNYPGAYDNIFYSSNRDLPISYAGRGSLEWNY